MSRLPRWWLLFWKPFAERPFHTVVDYIGVGSHIERYNDVLHGVTCTDKTNFGIEEMLKIDA